MKESENIEQTEIRQMLLASAFKLYYSDMGIMSARLGMTLEALQGKEGCNGYSENDKELI